MWDGQAFTGAKVALILDGAILVYLRDDKPSIPYPNRWDIPGGGREGHEGPAECALRETEEEFGLRLPSHRLIWERFYPGREGGHPGRYFLAGTITREEVASIRFGDEGQHWEMMPIPDFLDHPLAVPRLQDGLLDYLAHNEGR